MEGIEAVFDAIKDQTASGLIALLPTAYNAVSTDVERAQIEGFFLTRAKEIDCVDVVKVILKSIRKEEKAAITTFKKQTAQAQIAARQANGEAMIQFNERGQPLQTIDNFVSGMQDAYYAPVRFNLVSNRAEWHRINPITNELTIEPWTDTDISASKHYLETTYGIYSKDKHRDALKILFKERSYNPITDILDRLQWDGEERCEQFLTKWLKADDNEYVHEVSRLIFAEAVARAYLPGCKCDDVPILIGKQGSGKSTAIRYLAIHDNLFGEVKTVEGDKACEQLQGKWICEIPELSAFTKAREVESIKAFMTRQFDNYRTPYAELAEDRPRRCVFLGSTNNPTPLVDATGNRRFYPIETHSDGYEISAREDEIREYILQCYAEAVAKRKRGEMPNYARPELVGAYREAQDNAAQDDWRIGAIEQYLAERPMGSFVCVREIMRECLSTDHDHPEDPTPRDSKDISIIMSKMPGWERESARRYTEYGQQRGWIKTSGEAVIVPVMLPKEDELPF